MENIAGNDHLLDMSIYSDIFIEDENDYKRKMCLSSPRISKNNVLLNSPIFNTESQLSSFSLPLSGLESQKLLFKECKEMLEKKKQSFYGLPITVKDVMKQYRNISTLYAWQDECLNQKPVIEGQNFLYSLPTSGGKTLVAEILMLKTLLVEKKDALFILPFISIVQEKVQALNPFGLNLGFFVDEYAGNKGKLPPIKRLSKPVLYIATIEKAHLIINSLIETGRIKELGVLIVDEVHMIGEGGHRGANLEILLTKVICTMVSTRIIAMSATLKNLDELAVFLKAHLYVSDFRPIELLEYIKYDNCIFKVNRSKKSKFLEDFLDYERRISEPISKEWKFKDPDHIVSLTCETLSMKVTLPKKGGEETLERGTSCLIFCPTKSHCESTAKMLSEMIPEELSLSNVPEFRQKREDLLKNLRLDNTSFESNSSTGVCCPILEATIPNGVAYHHGGLTQEERKAIEEAYSDGIIRVICATSTLAAGVNLPARRVIIRKPYIGLEFLSWAQYNQMIGRAGRAGLDTHGESIIILKDLNERQNFARKLLLIDQESNQYKIQSNSQDCCNSSLWKFENGKGLRDLILTLIALGLVTGFNELLAALKMSLFAIQFKSCEKEKVPETFREAVSIQIRRLVNEGLIQYSANLQNFQLIARDIQELQEFVSTERPQFIDSISVISTQNAQDMSLCFKASQLGRATVKGGLDADNINNLINDLRYASQNFVAAGPLHMLYLVVPKEHVDQMIAIKQEPLWAALYNRVTLLPQEEQNLVTLLGFPESYLMRKAANITIKKKVDEKPLYRLYFALVLYDLWPWPVGSQSSQLASRHTLMESMMDVSQRYKIPRGQIQSILTSAASLAQGLGIALAGEFVHDPQLWAFGQLLPQFALKLSHCVCSELLPLMELPGVKRARAKQLFQAGFKSPSDIAQSSASELVTALKPFISYKQANSLIQSSQMFVADVAEALTTEAAQLMEILASSAPSVLSRQNKKGNQRCDNNDDHDGDPFYNDEDDLFSIQ